MSHLGARIMVVLREGRPYELRDTRGNLITKKEAMELIRSEYKVSEETRQARRRRKRRILPAGAACPNHYSSWQAIQGHESGDRSHRRAHLGSVGDSGCYDPPCVHKVLELAYVPLGSALRGLTLHLGFYHKLFFVVLFRVGLSLLGLF
jgi:hypothetical protein